MEIIKQQGVTLIELLVTIVIMAIVASIAVPALKTTIVNGRIEATANRLRNTFIAARNKAIECSEVVTVSADDIAAAKSVLVNINANGVDSVTFGADGIIDSASLEHTVFSICQDGSTSDVYEKVVIVYPSGLVSIKDEKQLISNENDESNTNQSISCP